MTKINDELQSRLVKGRRKEINDNGAVRAEALVLKLHDF